MQASDLIDSLKRTLVPIIVGAVATSFLAPHVNLEALDQVLSGVISGVYYFIVRLLEAKHPGASLLLGSRKVPIYFDSKM